jgi:hypothetical protein
LTSVIAAAGTAIMLRLMGFIGSSLDQAAAAGLCCELPRT